MTVPPNNDQARKLGQERLAARRKRTSGIRKGVATAAAAMFVAGFGTIYGQVASGTDPGLAKSSTTATTAAAAPTSTTTAATSSSAGSSATSSTASTPSAVTTRQS
jgi:hypothetical protein